MAISLQFWKCIEIDKDAKPLAVIDPAIGTLLPAWECKQSWLLRNFVPTIDFASYASL